MIHVGRMRDLVTFYRDVPTVAADGEKVEGATEWFSTWAEVVPIQGRERILAMQQQSDVTYRVRVRSDSLTRQLSPIHWLLLPDGTRLNITRIFDPDRKRAYLELECTERVAVA
jgi:SPP1 family predicted phage head-tail adaptor